MVAGSVSALLTYASLDGRDIASKGFLKEFLLLMLVAVTGFDYFREFSWQCEMLRAIQSMFHNHLEALSCTVL